MSLRIILVYHFWKRQLRFPCLSQHQEAKKVVLLLLVTLKTFLKSEEMSEWRIKQSLEWLCTATASLIGKIFRSFQLVLPFQNSSFHILFTWSGVVCSFNSNYSQQQTGLLNLQFFWLFICNQVITCPANAPLIYHSALLPHILLLQRNEWDSIVE